MTDHTLPADLSTLDARRRSAHIELSDDASSYRCVRVFGAPPDRVFRAFTDPAAAGAAAVLTTASPSCFVEAAR